MSQSYLNYFFIEYDIVYTSSTSSYNEVWCINDIFSDKYIF